MASGLEWGARDPRLCPPVSRRIGEAQECWQTCCKGTHGSWVPVFLLTIRNYFGILVPGQLSWYKPAEYHFCLQEPLRMSSVRDRMVLGLPSTNHSPPMSHGLLPDQAELHSSCPLGPWKTHVSLPCQGRECSKLFKSLPAADFLQFSSCLAREGKGTSINRHLKHCFLLTKE